VHVEGSEGNITLGTMIVCLFACSLLTIEKVEVN
jgi:hypothetical protein